MLKGECHVRLALRRRLGGGGFLPLQMKEASGRCLWVTASGHGVVVVLEVPPVTLLMTVVTTAAAAAAALVKAIAAGAEAEVNEQVQDCSLGIQMLLNGMSLLFVHFFLISHRRVKFRILSTPV